MPLTKKEQARYRVIVRQLSKLAAAGWSSNTHPDFEFLEAELSALAAKMVQA